MKKFRWTDWLAAAALVLAIGAFAGADELEPMAQVAQASQWP
jgi:hypothetical protein